MALRGTHDAQTWRGLCQQPPRKGLCRPRRPAALVASPFPAKPREGLRGAAPSLPAQAWTSPKGCRLWRLYGGAKRHRGLSLRFRLSA